MKKIHSALTLLICLFLVNCSQKKTNEFTLTGVISGQDTGNIILNYMPDNKMVPDTVKITNGKFFFHGQIKEPHLSALFLDWKTNMVMLFIEPGTMTITLTKDNFEDFKMTGSKSQDEYSFLNNLLISIQEKSKADSIKLKFIIENPESYVSAYFLQSMVVGNEKISLDSLRSVFDKIDTTVQKGRLGNKISDDIRKRENIQIGILAPDFKATDLNNKTLTLSQFKNKNIVLLDFWASWCIPCRNNIPHLKTIYTEYHPKGLEIVAISVDYDKKAWISTVQEEKTNHWYNIHSGFDRYNPENIKDYDVYSNYFYSTIPTQILIDFDGKIIGHWIGSTPENNTRLENLLKERLIKK